MALSVQELHEFVDLLNHPDEDIKKEAEQKVCLWETDVLPNQIWVSHQSDDIICTIINIKKGKVEVSLVDQNTFEVRPAYFGFSSFLKSWRRLV